MNRAKIYIKSEISETDATISFNLPWYHGMASDFSNIRFFMSPYRIIPHWIESYTSDSAKVWIKPPSIHPGINIVFVEWGNWNNGRGDIEGIAYKRIGDDFEGTSLDTSKWNQGIGSAGGTISVEDGVLKLAPNKPSSGGNSCCIWTNTTITNGFIIRERRKFTDEHYADLGLPVEEPSNFNTIHANDVCSQAYAFNQQSPISGNDEKCVYLIYKYSNGYSFLDYIHDSNLTSLNAFHINEYYYTHDGLLRWVHTPSTGEPGWDLSATHTAYLDDQKYILLFQGKYYNGNGGTSYIDWVFVRKYLDPEPELLDIRPIQYNRYMVYELLESMRQHLRVFTLACELIPKSAKVYTQVREVTERLAKTYTSVIEVITKNVQNYTQIRESVEKALKEFTQIKEIAERDLKSYTQILETTDRLLKIYPEITEAVPEVIKIQTKITEVTERDLKTFTKIAEIILTSLKTVDKLQYLKSSHNVIIYNNVFPFPAMKIDSATANENVNIYSILTSSTSGNYTVFTIPANTEDTIIESDPISLTGSISVSFEGSLPSNATAYVSVNNTLYQMKNIGNYYYRTVRDITLSDTVKFIIKSTSADTDTKVFIRNIQIENTDEPTAYVSAGSSRDAGFLSYNFDPEKIKAIMLYVYTPESSNEKTILYMPTSNVYLYVKGSKLYLNNTEILDWGNDQWNLVYIDSNGVRVNTDSYSTTINFLSDILYVAQKNGENHLNGFISMLTFLKKELSDPVKVMSSLIVR